MYALGLGNDVEAIAARIADGTDIDEGCDSDDEDSALIGAVGRYYVDNATVHFLIDAGASVNHEGFEGRTPLQVASGSGHVAAVRMLLDARALINKTDSSDATALHTASDRSRSYVVRLLIERGAGMDFVEIGGRTARQMAGSQMADVFDAHACSVAFDDLVRLHLLAQRVPVELIRLLISFVG